MVETVFTDEDKKNLKVLAEKLPKLHTVVEEELTETLEILNDEKPMKSIDTSLKTSKKAKCLATKKC